MPTGGSLVHVGAGVTPLALPPVALMVRCWRFLTTRACARDDTRAVLRLLETGALAFDELITHRFALTDAIKAVDAIQHRVDKPMWMTVVNP